MILILEKIDKLNQTLRFRVKIQILLNNTFNFNFPEKISRKLLFQKILNVRHFGVKIQYSDFSKS